MPRETNLTTRAEYDEWIKNASITDLYAAYAFLGKQYKETLKQPYGNDEGLFEMRHQKLDGITRIKAEIELELNARMDALIKARQQG